ncbi:hypothetical protein NDR87_33270 [Nocardia sp. CDC159]|uniref:Cytochrome P450 n=1 Tax=Nocardia pulmonis TaxID=2951408 RepID=A0A9X2ECK4_9NOCA|nr:MULTISPECIES: hypothetical protein [Nocardia]MCM6778349.1 hypothetical protein [Nocardia pulmonis]MCM6791255.1 hypothetical protein [Nocardia sp. CDC159]
MPELTTVSDPERARNALVTSPIPPVPPAELGMAWLRATVARFCDGPDHRRRRALILAELRRLSLDRLRERARELACEPHPQVQALAEAMGLPAVSAQTVAIAASGYLPPAPVTPAVDRAVADLVRACGPAADEMTAARVSILIQACAATAALIERARVADAPDALTEVLRTDPPVRRTRRLVDGIVTEIDLTTMPFGAGPHECPGRSHALALAAGVLEATR